jgi:hypothetical protein
MKTHNGFVSNSSSTSFCIIGVASNPTLYKLAAAEKLHFKWDEKQPDEFENIRGCEHKIGKNDLFCKICGSPAYIQKEIVVNYDDMPYGFCGGKVVDFYGNGWYPSYAGIDAQKLLDKMTIPQAKEHFRKLIKEKLNIDISPAMVGFMYGEVSSE